MFKQVQAFILDEEGATAIEYALIAGLIAAVLVTTLTDVGSKVKSKLGEIVTALTTTTPTP